MFEPSARTVLAIKNNIMLQTFSERVIKIALEIPKGRVTTYGRIARAAGAGPMASQSITSILGKAYTNGIKNIPFHRICLLYTS